MIERFNFYDVYGRLIPGVSLLLLLFLPFGIVTGHWPNSSPASALAALVPAYLLGYLLQSIGTTQWLSSKLARDQKGTAGFPSVLMLNPSNTRYLGDSLKNRIQQLVEQRFSLKLHVEQEIFLSRPEDDAKEKTDEQKRHDKIAKDREDAFFLCRPIANKSISYAEQFQGLYSLMCGLCVVFALGLFYDLGWLLSFWHNAWVVLFPFVLIAVSTLFLIIVAFKSARRTFFSEKKPCDLEKYAFHAFALVFFAVGHISGEDMQVHASEKHFLALLAVAAFSVIAAFRAFVLYGIFANEFAKAVWTYFAVLDKDSAL